MAGAADLKKDAVLALHLNFFVVELPRQIHRAENLQHLFATEARLFRWFRFATTAQRLDCPSDLQHRRRGSFWFGPRYAFSGEGFFGQSTLGFFNQSENLRVAHIVCFRRRRNIYSSRSKRSPSSFRSE